MQESATRSGPRLDTLGRVSLLAVPFMAGLACTPRLTLEQYDLPKYAGLAALLAVLALARPGLLSARRLLGFPALALLAGLVALSTALSPAPLVSLAGDHENIAGLATWLLYAGLFLAGTGAGTGGRTGAAVIAAAAVSSLYALVQLTSFDPFRGSYFQHVRGFAGNPDFLAEQLAMALPFAFAWALARRSAAGWAVSALFLGVLALTASRAGMLAGVSGAAFLVLFSDNAWRPSRAFLLKAVLPAAAGLLLLAEAVVPAEISLRGRFTQLLSDSGSSFAGTRGELWAGVARVVRDAPLGGCGTDALKSPFLRHAPAGWASREGLGISARNAHNEPLHLWATVGALGLGAWLWLVLCAFRAARPRLGDPATAATLAAVAAFLVHNQFSFGSGATAPVFWLLLGSLFAGRQPGESTVVRKGPSAGGILYPALALAFFAYLAADGFAFVGNEAGLAGRNDLVPREFRRARLLAPWASNYAVREAGALEEAGRGGEALPLFELASSRDPRSGILLGNVARVRFAIASKSRDGAGQESALADLKRAVELAPTQPTLYGSVIMALQQAGRTAERDEYVRRLWLADPGWAAKMLGGGAQH